MIIIFLTAIGWPLAPMDSTHPLCNNYGEYQQYGGPQYLHSGIDPIADTIGVPVYAIQSGVVKSWLTASGQYHWSLGIADYETTDSVEGWGYWHIDTSRYHKEIGDPVTEGELIGYIVEWPVIGFDHVHLERIKDSGAVWEYPDMAVIQNPLVIISPYDDTTKPVIENALEYNKFGFCQNNSYFILQPDSLYGDVDIIAKIYDETGLPLPDTVWERLAPYKIEYEIHGQQDLPTTLSFIFYGVWDCGNTDIVDIIYKKYQPWFTQGNYNFRNFYFIVTNTNGDSITEPADTNYSWVTTDFPNGDYWVIVTAYDVVGNWAKDSMLVTVANTGIEEQIVAISPLLEIIPNPINHNTAVQFMLPSARYATLKVYDISGRQVKSLVNGKVDAGKHAIDWNACDNAGRKLPSGVFFLRFQAGDYKETKKLILLR